VNIWIFNPYDPLPGEGLGALRYAQLAEVLVSRGHTVTWWSADWSHTLKARRSPSLENRKLTVKLVAVPSYRRNISLRRVWSHLSYARGIAKQSVDHADVDGKPDIILFSVPPMESGAVALKLGRLYGARVVLDVMDAWPETLQLALQGSSMPAAAASLVGRVGLWPYARLMRRYCREADAVCAQSDAFANHARRYGAVGKIGVFRLAAGSMEQGAGSMEQGAGSAERGAGSAERVAGGAELGSGEPILRLVYLGSMGRVYDLETLVDAVLRFLREGRAIELDLVGEGEQRVALGARVAAAGQASAIRFHGYQTGEPLNQILAKADVGVIPMDPGSQVAVPYKAADYLSFGLVVVNSLPGELEAMLERDACGMPYTAGDVGSLMAAIRPWLEQPALRQRGREGARRLFAAEFDGKRVYGAMASFLETS
jgi:glycosyltransferase involved in cell wall biosynthesis